MQEKSWSPGLESSHDFNWWSMMIEWKTLHHGVTSTCKCVTPITDIPLLIPIYLLFIKDPFYATIALPIGHPDL